MGQKTESKKTSSWDAHLFFSHKNKQKAKEDKWFISQFMSCIFCNVTQLTRLNNGHTSKAHPILNKSFKKSLKIEYFCGTQCVKFAKNVSFEFSDQFQRSEIIFEGQA